MPAGKRERLEIVRTIVEDEKSLLLRRRGGECLELVLGNVVLLSSAALETEHTFGRLAADALTSDSEPEPTILIGGLGFGATLRGVLEVAPSGAKVIVVEKLRTVIDVARNEAASLVAGALDDPRVVVLHRDVADVISEAADGSLAAILLDVDNGPEWASFRSNASLYGETALIKARTRLKRGGLYAVWSGYPADAFVRTLRKAGFFPQLKPLYERASSASRGAVRARAYVGTVPAEPCSKTS